MAYFEAREQNLLISMKPALNCEKNLYTFISLKFQPKDSYQHNNMEDNTAMASASFDAHITRLQAAALGATRKSAVLPTDIAFHRSMDPEFARGLDAFSDRVLAMTNKLLNLVSTVDQTQTSRGKGKAKLENQDDVVDNFHSLIVDSVDQLLEKTVRRF